MNGGHGPFPLIRRHAIFGLRFRISTEMELLFPAICFLANQVNAVRLNVTALGKSSMDIFATQELCLRMHVIAQQGLLVCLEQLGGYRLAGIAVKAGFGRLGGIGVKGCDGTRHIGCFLGWSRLVL